MLRKSLLIATLSLASFLTTSAFADEAEPLPGKVKEKTYYNGAEANRARDREAAYVTADPAGRSYSERERVRMFQVTPIFGMEFASLDRILTRTDGGLTSTNVPTSFGFAPATGLALDWRLGYFTIGARYQGSVFLDNDISTNDLYLNKVYADFGFNVRAKVMLFSATVSGGYAFAVTRDLFAHGVGARVGVNFDFLITKFFSLGPGFAFDVHAYRQPGTNGNTMITAFGGTSQLRIGFHI